ncbi:hypothetical protein [Ciceribacter sp. L1K22]|uniref:hypothetical protein n=1 Tax=Ciceribacter sp. L1K22 TaxID=2820275 RepID=UPI001ABE21A7|nr:hypothetical protein [Ciceribacter sp. L1K22]MBO3760078.1 hypothetical protein [Ciceribacter sp. L1K22]
MENLDIAMEHPLREASAALRDDPSHPANVAMKYLNEQEKIRSETAKRVTEKTPSGPDDESPTAGSFFHLRLLFVHHPAQMHSRST